MGVEGGIRDLSVRSVAWENGGAWAMVSQCGEIQFKMLENVRCSSYFEKVFLQKE